MRARFAVGYAEHDLRRGPLRKERSGFGEISNAEIIGPDRAAPRWDAEFEELFRVLQPICSFPERPALSFCVSRSLEEREGRSKPNRRCNQPHAERESTRQRG